MDRKYCGVINTETNILENIIVADIEICNPYNNTYFIDLTQILYAPGRSPFDIGWVYNPETQIFTNPNPDPIIEEDLAELNNLTE